jgi:hypothetical protein
VSQPVCSSGRRRHPGFVAKGRHHNDYRPAVPKLELFSSAPNASLVLRSDGQQALDLTKSYGVHLARFDLKMLEIMDLEF